MDAGRSLRRARRGARLTQRTLAARTGVAQPTIARIERGVEEPRVATLAKLLAACGHRLETHVVGGVGIDRTAIRELLARSPAERASLAVAEARALADIPVGALAERHRASPR